MHIVGIRDGYQPEPDSNNNSGAEKKLERKGSITNVILLWYGCDFSAEIIQFTYRKTEIESSFV